MLATLIRVALLVLAAYWAYDIRLYAIRDFGRLIHEFDPWFNFHATRYLFEHGIQKFFKWFDHTVWYPLGRPVGTTIYPGMQLTSVAIWHVLDRLNMPMSLNDICVFVPCWFGALASVITGLLAAECSGIPNAAPAAAMIMAVIPAHIMRSVGGGYDNESIAVTAMVLTFYLWNRSLRTASSWPISIAAGLAYVYMAAAWGGYVFVINTIGAHAALLLALGRFDASVYKAYTIFFLVGTLGAMQIPVVSLTPLKSMEQIMPLGVFCVYQILACCDLLCKQRGLARGSPEALQLRNKVLLTAGGAVAIVMAVLMQLGHFGPLSARVRGLFVKHMRTGNPLVDSVAEHQPTNSGAYWMYLNIMCLFAPAGWFTLFYKPTNSKIFMLMYSAFGYFFASKMNRLIILMGPIASALGGIAMAVAVNWVLAQRVLVLKGGVPAAEQPEKEAADDGKPGKKSAKAGKPGKKGLKPVGLSDNVREITDQAKRLYNSPMGQLARLALAAVVVITLPYVYTTFFSYCHSFAQQTSNPSLVFHAQLNSGERIVVDDYLDSYNWLAANTPKDARVLSWWDYGYQISGIANRTTLADGNTWNHDHIALVGRMLTSEEKKAHQLIRHLADYVLVWSGGGGDDLAKSPHMARIGNSVYPDICPNDPLCYSFSIDEKGNPTPTMAASLLFKLTENGNRPGVQVDESLFKQVYVSKYRKVKIYEVQKVSQKSKKWLADPANKKCDRPGSWYCPGQYPPGLPLEIKTGHATLNYDKHGKAGIPGLGPAI